jgi:hypothetical protein
LRYQPNPAPPYLFSQSLSQPFAVGAEGGEGAEDVDELVDEGDVHPGW